MVRLVRIDANILRHSVDFRQLAQSLGEDDEEWAGNQKRAEKGEPVGVEFDGNPVRAQQTVVEERDVVDDGRESQQEEIDDNVANCETDNSKPPATLSLQGAGPDPQTSLQVHDDLRQDHDTTCVPHGRRIVKRELEAVDGERLVFVEGAVFFQSILLYQATVTGFVSSEAVHVFGAVRALLDQKLTPESNKGTVEDENKHHEQHGKEPRPHVPPVYGVDIGLMGVPALGKVRSVDELEPTVDESPARDLVSFLPDLVHEVSRNLLVHQLGAPLLEGPADQHYGVDRDHQDDAAQGENQEGENEGQIVVGVVAEVERVHNRIYHIH